MNPPDTIETPSATAAVPSAADTIPVPGDMLLTLLNGLEFARHQGAFNTAPLHQLYALIGVQLYVGSLTKPPA